MSAQLPLPKLGFHALLPRFGEQGGEPREHAEPLEVQPVHALQDLVPQLDELASFAGDVEGVLGIGEPAELPHELEIDPVARFLFRLTIEEVAHAAR